MCCVFMVWVLFCVFYFIKHVYGESELRLVMARTSELKVITLWLLGQYPLFSIDH